MTNTHGIGNHIREVDPEIERILEREWERQQYKINLIASENYASPAVREAQGCIMTNKYAEGYPHRRYYGGCEWVDEAEELAIERAKKLFGAEHVNVQPHSGSQANMAVYFAVLKPGDTILSMDLSHGGHLSHGSPISFSGKLYNVVSYGVSRDTERIDYAEVEALAREHRPQMIVCGASSYPREIDFKAFAEIAEDVGAYLLADIAHIAGMVAVGLHNSPIPHADFVSTTTHKTLRGPRGGMVMCREEYAKLLDKALFPGIQGGPLMHVIAAKAVALKEALSPEFAEYQRRILDNAKRLAQGLIQGGFDLVSGGTDNHLMLVDLNSIGITGKEAEERLSEVGIILNKNTIPFETRKPFIASGIRLGTPAITTRGFGTAEMDQIAEWVEHVLRGKPSKEEKLSILEGVREMCARYPIW
ncbi:serine hydroxymethyltransferase [Methermicoccus shengliensis]|uniref:serine hydroxymethyltransferase n=1 Tax=Methermicoccus shengliensis TaxID=660064 RepID=UPI00076BFB30|nr:serine hydroxymethyltransferase [Methermicoccus shengliensis]KUK04100.1 MAG: Serine hydroxymethyltransferase [Euryarchaeota archaeon 55_53]KUK29842.1 MAG: Serine hydroxymethyltransferase [Methanosarcinales archeaon 56_1174]MDI3488485.1 glycine hydroxymethyltransferase [Methanosarcinales archaeon]MDN5294818.1 glycine hydroxymethyltransferase [Methanosarcinales archaeon]